MSLIAQRIDELINNGMTHLNLDHVDAIAALLRSTGRYSDPEVGRLVLDVLGAEAALSGPDADNARYLSGTSR